MTQYGFYVDANNCFGCHVCQVACKDVNRLAVGQNFRKVTSYCTGEFPNVQMYHVAISCQHCTNPACVERSMRAAISQAWERIGEEACAQVFGPQVRRRGRAPSNVPFLTAMTAFLDDRQGAPRPGGDF